MKEKTPSESKGGEVTGREAGRIVLRNWHDMVWHEVGVRYSRRWNVVMGCAEAIIEDGEASERGWKGGHLGAR